MSYIFQLSDEQYARLAAYAAQQKQTPETLFQAWVSEMTSTMKTSTSSRRERREERTEEAVNHPLFKVAGMFAIGEPGWADKHDEYLAEAYGENHADDQ